VNLVNAVLPAVTPPAASVRWVQLVIGIVCMAMIANLQYGWTLFVDPMAARHGWSRSEIQFAFTIFVVTETWLVPVEAWFVDRYGPALSSCLAPS
jgi:OFA family oxalate/formate antiporter-like MFS transporter